MSLRIGGMGWVTPLGSEVAPVWERLLMGEEAVAESVSSTLGARTYSAYRVPAAATGGAPAHPRLRRSSAISRFAAVAGLAALADAEVKIDQAMAARTAVIFAVSNGGVIYTKRFYHEVVESGAHAASPLLFPETVFNAPASHLAAILGVTGASYTLVGDGAVGLLALKMAEDLMQSPTLDRCLVVSAEEVDWLLCDAYQRWHLLRESPPIATFDRHPRGTILSEGAGAVVVDRTGPLRIDQACAGCNFEHQREAAGCVLHVFERLGVCDDDIVVASANGTFIDAAEVDALRRRAPNARVYAPKAALGESVGASSLWQVICAAQALQTQQLPPLANAREDEVNRGGTRRSGERFTRAIVSGCGMNQQVAGLSLSLAS